MSYHQNGLFSVGRGSTFGEVFEWFFGKDGLVVDRMFVEGKMFLTRLREWPGLGEQRVYWQPIEVVCFGLVRDV